MERKKDVWYYKFLGYLYDMFSEYCQNPARALSYLIFLTAGSYGLIVIADAATLSNHSPVRALCDGSQKNVVINTEHEMCNPRWRAWLLAVKPVVNPLGYFQSHPHIVPRYWWINVWLFVQWLSTLTLIMLFVLSIRGRFKFE